MEAFKPTLKKELMNMATRKFAKVLSQYVNTIFDMPLQIGDIKIIDGFIVNGSWKLVGWIASGVRRLQTGYLYHYALVMAAGVLLLLSYFVTWPMLEPIVSKWLGH